MVSKMATTIDGSKLKWDHDTFNGIINGYYSPGRMLTYLKVTKLLHKLGTSVGQLSQCTS